MSEMTIDQVRALCEPLRDVDAAYSFSSDLPAHDFNRELGAPGVHPDFPHGVVGIRTDEDFWLVATLPYDLVDTPLPTIVEALWPNVADPEFLPDTHYTPPSTVVPGAGK